MTKLKLWKLADMWNLRSDVEFVLFSDHEKQIQSLLDCQVKIRDRYFIEEYVTNRGWWSPERKESAKKQLKERLYQNLKSRFVLKQYADEMQLSKFREVINVIIDEVLK